MLWNRRVRFQIIPLVILTNMAAETAPRDRSKNLNGKRKRRRKPRLTGLSKQRQTANARERTRMRSISAAMLQLRYRLPSSFAPREKKLSKIQTLRLAIRYIGDLWNVLQSGESDTEIHSVNSDLSQQGEEELVDKETGELERPKHCFKFEREKTQCAFL